MKESESRNGLMAAFGEMVEVIRALRAEDGCPWDKKQTLESFHPYILEEYHEMVQAMNLGLAPEIVDEMGDLIFQVVYVAYMLEQLELATIADILHASTNKMIRRHPHVFGDATVRNAEEVMENWVKIKASEDGIRERASHLDGIPRSLPALTRAHRLTKRAKSVGFDWAEPSDVFPKISEELAELKEVTQSGDPNGMRDEFGDLLFVLVNAARLFKVNAESALNRTSDKFESRFRHIEARLQESNRSLEDATLEEMDALWDEAKALEKGRDPHEDVTTKRS